MVDRKNVDLGWKVERAMEIWNIKFRFGLEILMVFRFVVLFVGIFTEGGFQRIDVTNDSTFHYIISNRS